MPTRPGKQCNKPGCPIVANAGKSYCPEHKILESKWRNYKTGQTASQRGYGSVWKRLRLVILKRDKYLCQEHLKNTKYVAGNIVDHIVPKARGGSDSQYNLQTLCDDCHAIKTAHEHLADYQHGGGVYKS